LQVDASKRIGEGCQNPSMEVVTQQGHHLFIRSSRPKSPSCPTLGQQNARYAAAPIIFPPVDTQNPPAAAQLHSSQS
ncbi:MAG TPA: hypothetical protein VJU54_00625, partial [Nitrospiraceae bacterium]|nr:hypothetical protein [Nitrospiraceae bacterium]